jgi:hypothetical protein
MIDLALYCACGRSLVMQAHEKTAPDLKRAFEHVHGAPDRPRCRPIGFAEWEVIRAQEEASFEDLLRDQGVKAKGASTIAHLTWGPRARGPSR